MNNKKLLYFQIISYFVSSISLALTSFVSYEDSLMKKIISIIIGILFWAGLVVGIILIFVAKKQNENLSNAKGIGLISFFKNRPAICFDVIMIVSLIISIVVIVIQSESFIGSLIIALFVFSFEMHCILNGKTYNSLRETGEKNNG